MEERGNVPVQLFCVVSTLGDLTPIRFRYEDEEHRIRTVSVQQVLAQKEVRLAGCKAILFTCSALLDDGMAYFELKYNIDTHRWVFCRRMN